MVRVHYHRHQQDYEGWTLWHWLPGQESGAQELAPAGRDDFGLVFELPLVILLLVRLGILNHRILSEKRRYAIVAIFILAAIMTPGPDAVSQVIMALPLLLLYELCVWGARMMQG